MKANRKGVGWFISILEERVRIHVYMFNNGHYYILQLKIKMELKKNHNKTQEKLYRSKEFACQLFYGITR